MAITLKGDGVGLEAIAYMCWNRECGWYRRYTPKYTWLNSVVNHPEHGRISQRQLVINDVNNHVCARHIEVKNFMKAMGV